MKRRSKAGGKTGKPKRPKAATPKRSIRPKAAPGGRSTAQGMEIAHLVYERDEALEREKASAEVLRVISASPGELEPVFQAMLDSAVRICDAKFGMLLRFDGERFQFAAASGSQYKFVEHVKRIGPFRPLPRGHLARIVQTKQAYHTADDAAEAVPGPATQFAGARSTVGVPMLKAGEIIGAIVIYRQEVRPFTDKQIGLVQNFATQAVIAIENTRLLSELRQRTDDLTESLAQQTATSEVLRVISTSPGELGPVFQAIMDNATRICGAEFGVLYLYDGDAYRVAAAARLPEVVAEKLQGPLRPGEGTAIGRVAKTMKAVHIVDLPAEGFGEQDAQVRSAAAEFGIRTLLAVPMIKDGGLIGAISIFRREVRAFSDKQIALVQNFAAQAVIAIENTRLLSELRDALERQTATSEVLSVISSSPDALETVFQTMLENATRICEAKFGTLFRFENNAFAAAARVGTPPELADFQKQRGPFLPTPGSHLDRMMRTKKVCHSADEATEAVPGAAARLGGARSVIYVPVLKDDTLVGAIVIYRQEVRPFTDKQIELVQNFAAQAVIAIENARLLSELRESLQQQTATSEVLQVISSSPGELSPIFDVMLANATRICEASFCTLFLCHGDAIEMTAQCQNPPALIEYLVKRGRYVPPPKSPLGRIVQTKRMLHSPDIAAEEDIPSPAARLGGARAYLGVPMLKEDELVGIIVVFRHHPGSFKDKQIEIVANFAAQAVIAIENTRLLNELRQRTDDLSQSLEDLRTAQDRLVQTQKLASLGQLTAGIAHEIKNPLNFVNNFSSVSVELIDELQETLGRVATDDKTRGEIAELADTLRDNLGKIVQHGKRADSIVKNMLLHSREGSGERRPVDVNALVEESLNLAYHGARAEKQSFNVTLERSFDPAAGEIDAFPQEITRVLLNLIANGFYAATKRQALEGGNGYEPTITAATKGLGNRVEIRIRDNGIGIPAEVREKMFNPFFTTKPAGEGTGLGLSISHDIIVKQHSGSVEVDTEPGRFTEFRIILPRTTT